MVTVDFQKTASSLNWVGSSTGSPRDSDDPHVVAVDIAYQRTAENRRRGIFFKKKKQAMLDFLL